MSGHLSPFALYTAFPCSLDGCDTVDSYEDSVTIGLAPRRRSRVPAVLNVLARRRCPIHPLACARCTSPILRRVRTAKVYRHAHDGAASRRGRGECEVPPLEIGVRAMPLSPYRTGLAGRHGTRLPVPPAFPTGSCPLRLSPSGQSMTQESPFELFLIGSRIQHRVPRRTLSAHPAPIVQPQATHPFANGQIDGAAVGQSAPANAWLGVGGPSASCISAWPIGRVSDQGPGRWRTALMCSTAHSR